MTREEAIKVASEMYGWLKTDRERDALETLIPELAESEDDRIRKELVDLVKRHVLPEDKQLVPGGHTTMEEAITYLEKQKEQKSGEIRVVYPNNPKRKEIGFYYSKKEVCWEDMPIEVRMHDYDYYFRDGMDYYPFKPDDEQKSAEWDKLQEEFRNINEAFEAGKKEVVAHPEKYGLCKPVEWNEEEEEMLDIVLAMVDCSTVVPHSGGQLHPSESYKKDISEWLKSLRPQQKDNKCISPKEGDIVVNKYGEISVFENWGHHPDGGSFNDKTYFFAKCTLKGDYYNDCDCHPESEGLRYATPEEIRKIVPYLLQSLRPSWKPSEEQMKALESARLMYVHGLEREDIAVVLESLYEQLKKLM